MKITLAIPKDKKFKNRLEKEINSARNIKDKNTSKQVINGLTKILSFMSSSNPSGKVYLFNGDNDSLEVYDYPLDEFVYYCGDNFKKPDNTPNLNNTYLLVVMDANEVTIGLSNGGGNPVTLLNESSLVPGKHNSGGQSKARFQRNRQLALVQWFKHCGGLLKEVSEGLKK